MSTKLPLLALLAGCCALTAPVWSAQLAPAPTGGPALPSIESLTTALNLTPVQAATIQPLLADITAAQQSILQQRADIAGMRGGLADRAAVLAALSDAQKKQIAEYIAPPQYTSRVPILPGQHVDWASRLDWDLADLLVFRDANAKLGPPAPGENRVVFLGDSITENWQNSFRTLYPDKPNYIGRGRTSETTQQMLIRFRPDVIDLKPKAVVILAGTNDIAGNMGRSTDKMIQDNLIGMIDLAELNKIKVVLCSILPTTRYSWQPSVTDGTVRVIALNKWLKEYSATRPGEVFYVDAHAPLAGPTGGMNPQFSSDGTHPNATGYALISPLVEQAINAALATK